MNKLEVDSVVLNFGWRETQVERVRGRMKGRKKDGGLKSVARAHAYLKMDADAPKRLFMLQGRNI